MLWIFGVMVTVFTVFLGFQWYLNDRQVKKIEQELVEKYKLDENNDRLNSLSDKNDELNNKLNELNGYILKINTKQKNYNDEMLANRWMLIPNLLGMAQDKLNLLLEEKNDNKKYLFFNDIKNSLHFLSLIDTNINYKLVALQMLKNDVKKRLEDNKNIDINKQYIKDVENYIDKLIADVKKEEKENNDPD